MAEMREQAERFGARILDGEATGIDLAARPFTVETDDQILRAEALIVATGARARWLGIPSEKRLMGRGVSACATCDGFFFKGKEVVVVGGGDTALEDADYLSRLCAKVTVVHRRGELRASKAMQERAHANAKIAWELHRVVAEVVGESGVTGVVLEDVRDRSRRTLPCDGVFVAIGHDPNTRLLEGKLELDDAGYIVCRGRGSATSVPGVFAAGDVADPTYRQAVTSAGSGCVAAIDAERFLVH
jgi:thioredoxin reductase (NADPH)